MFLKALHKPRLPIGTEYAKFNITNPNIMLRKPVIEGTRVTLEVVLEKLAVSLSHRDILLAYPRLTEKDIMDVVAFSNRT
jgi:uncharacterized protein (DUF433 family)